MRRGTRLRGTGAARKRVGLAAVAAALLVTTACTGGVVPGFGRPDAGAPTEPTSTPSVSRLDAAIAALPERIGSLLDETGVPGLAVAVVAGGETVYAEGFGIADLDTGAVVGPETVFQLASVSKPVGATAIARLVGQGEASWDARVADALPWFRLAEAWPSAQLTVADLYSHRSGLPDHAGDDLEWLGFDQRTILERLRLLPLDSFRSEYAYTNYGIQAGALAVAEPLDTTWEELSERVLYEPLGMDRTTSSFAEYTSWPDHAVGHMVVDGEWVVTPEQFDPAATAAAASVASSADDMARWMRMVLAGARGEDDAFIDAEALQAMLTPRMPTDGPGDDARLPTMYGYGVNLSVAATGDTLVGHSGAFAQGAGTFVGMVPAADLGIVVLTNGYPMGVAETVGAAFIDEALVGEQTRPWWDLYRSAFEHILEPTGELSGATPPAVASPADPLEDYTGTYRNAWVGDAVVGVRDGALVLLLGPEPGVRGREYVLEHWDGDVFRYDLEPVLAAAGSTSAVEFDPTAGTLTIEQFDGFGLGTLERVG